MNADAEQAVVSDGCQPPGRRPAVSYLHDVFLSYRRSAPVGEWVHLHFLPELMNWLPGEVGRPVSIFVDDGYRVGAAGIPLGASWPLSLQQALSRSRCLLAVFSPDYFWSSWCLAEFQTVRQREQRLGYRTPANPDGLVYAVKFNDGRSFPAEAASVQYHDFEHWNIHVPVYRETREYPDFIREVQTFCQRLAPAILAAPAWDASWPVLTPAAPERPPVEQQRL
jgi:hypothetical protein